MKYKTFIFILLLSLTIVYSFSRHEKTIDYHVELNNDSKDTSKLTPEEKKFYDSYNVIETKTFLFKGVKIYNNLDTLLNKLGKADSIVNPKYECGYYADLSAIIYYYPGYSFNVYKNIADINTIDFTKSNITINYKFGTLSKMTTLREIAEKFPKSYNEAMKEKDSTDIKTLRVRFFSEQNTDLFIDLLFIDEKLVSLDTWEDC